MEERDGMSGRGSPAANSGCTRRCAVKGAMLLTGGVLLGGASSTVTAREVLASIEPTIHTREDWGARPPRRTVRVLSRWPDHLVVHHTATPNGSDYSKSYAFSLSRGIQNWHMDHNGWNDTGQQLTISRGGHIMEGRDRSLAAIRDGDHVVGAQTANHNSHTLGIENEGTYSSVVPPERLMDALVDTLAWLCVVYELEPGQAIVGHRDFNATTCPGDRLYALLPRIRRDVADRIIQLREPAEEPEREEVPEKHEPDYPVVPPEEPEATHFHGPAVSGHDLARE